jgi:hypothetical protein
MGGMGDGGIPKGGPARVGCVNNEKEIFPSLALGIARSRHTILVWQSG